MIEINLIRHGHTEANEKKLYCGWTDLPLSLSGAEEINLLKQQHIYPESNVFFTSSLMRTKQTLEIIYGKFKKTVIPEITEYNFGSFEMQSYEQLKLNTDYQKWIMDKSGNVPCLNGESKNLFEKRIMQGFNKILNQVFSRKVNSAIIVCHGGTIVTIMEYLLPGIKKFYEWQPKPGRGYSLHYSSEGFQKYTII